MAYHRVVRRFATILLATALLACSCQEREANKMIEVADRHLGEAHYEEAKKGYEEIIARWPESSAAIRAAEGLDRLRNLDSGSSPPER